MSLVLSRANLADDTRPSESDIGTDTIGGWCLVDRLVHYAIASNGILLPLIKEHGQPLFYLDHIKNKITSSSDDDAYDNASNSDSCQTFQFLCHIVPGQQLAGSPAKKTWRRLVK